MTAAGAANAEPFPQTDGSSQSFVTALARWMRASIVGLAVISGVINLLALTGSFYMLQVYDRVLVSRSVPTLIVLSLLMIGLYVLFGSLEAIRSQVMMRLGGRLDRQLRGEVFSAVLRAPYAVEKVDASRAVQDLDQVRTFMAGPAPAAALDVPWLPVYFFMVYLLHPYLGLLATVGAGVLLVAALETERRSRAPQKAISESGGARGRILDLARRNTEVIRALGLEAGFVRRWIKVSETHVGDLLNASEKVGKLVVFSRVFRMALQSAILGLGAYVVIRGEATGGVMIASSIIAGRALAPIDTVISNWKGFVAAREAYARLGSVLKKARDPEPEVMPPDPGQNLQVQALVVCAPGSSDPILRGVSFDLQAGDGLGVIGPSASGKSSLARALVGVWAAAQGSVRLDGASLKQWSAEKLGPHIGYLPQDVEIFEGTIAQNIGRLSEQPDEEAIIAAARDAGIHEMIVALPKGYETNVGPGGAFLSAGQRQRLALARALYGYPFLIVLDEPNSNLDAEGDAALGKAVSNARKRGAIVVVVAHRPSALASVNKVLVMAGGQAKAFGPRDEILAKVTQPSPSAPPLAVVAAGAIRP